MKWTSLCLGSACALSVWVCGAEQFQQRFELAPVTHVQFDAFGTLQLSQADHNRLLVTADEDLTDYIQLDIEHQKLTVTDTRTDSIWFQTRRLWQQVTGDTQPLAQVHYQLALQQPESIQLNGFFDVDLDGLAGEELNLEYNGMGQLNGKALQFDQLQLDLNGKVATRLSDSQLGDVRLRFNGLGNLHTRDVISQSLSGALHGNISCQLNGVAHNLMWKMQGAGECEASGLASESATVDLQGAADMVIKVSKELQASTQQGASLSYFGSPKVTAKGSNIRRINGGYQARTYY